LVNVRTRQTLFVPARITVRTGLWKTVKLPSDLLQIDAAGASLATLGSVEEGQVVWLGLAALPTEWVKGCVAGVRKVAELTVYSLDFREECAPGLLDVARAAIARRPQAAPADDTIVLDAAVSPAMPGSW
jgi:hypothetical protein